jgi:glutaredoxin
VLLALLCACDLPPPQPSSGEARSGAAPASDASSARSASADTQTRKSSPVDPSIGSIESGNAKQVYYQFTDASGGVKFVSTLADVPAEWRDRVGFVEMDLPPPGTPGAAQRIREARAQRAREADSLPAAADDAGTYAEVLIYSADWCGACRAAKSYMDERGIAYEERNIDDPDALEEMIAKAGRGGIPVFDVNGEILRGFSPELLEQVIQRHS